MTRIALPYTTCDRIPVTDTDRAEQLVEEYHTVFELFLELDGTELNFGGDYTFAVQHESNTPSPDDVIGEPIDNIDFLSDIARIAEEDGFPYRLVEISAPTLDTHPAMAIYQLTADEIRLDMYPDHTSREWDVEEHGHVTDD